MRRFTRVFPFLMAFLLCSRTFADSRVQALPMDSPSLAEFFKITVLEGPADVEIVPDSMEGEAQWDENPPTLDLRFQVHVPAKYGQLIGEAGRINPGAAPSEVQQASVPIGGVRDNFARYVLKASGGETHRLTFRADLLSFADKVVVDPRCDAAGVSLHSESEVPAEAPALFLLACPNRRGHLLVKLGNPGSAGDRSYVIHQAVESQSKARAANRPNSVFLEVFGRGGLYSFNYEHVFGNRYGSGVSLTAMPSYVTGTIFENIYFPSGNHRPYAGLGLGPFQNFSGQFFTQAKAYLQLSPSAGYEYRASNHLLLRAAAYVIVSVDPLTAFPWAGVSLGYTF